MSPLLIPEDPMFTTESEREVWERLRDSLRQDDTLIANFRLTDTTKDHEADLVVVMPDVGVVVVEVKGAGIGYDDDGWSMQHRGRSERVDPVAQARDARYALQGYVESDRRWADSSRSPVRFAHAVVTPFTSLGIDFDLPDCPRWMIHDKHDLADLARRLADIPLGFETHRRQPTHDDCDVIVDILTARSLLPNGIGALGAMVHDPSRRSFVAPQGS